MEAKIHFIAYTFFFLLVTSQLVTWQQLQKQMYDGVALSGLMYPGGEVGITEYGNDTCAQHYSRPYAGLWSFNKNMCDLMKTYNKTIRYVTVTPNLDPNQCHIPNQINLAANNDIFSIIDISFVFMPLLTFFCMFFLGWYLPVGFSRDSAFKKKWWSTMSSIILSLYIVNKALILTVSILMFTYFLGLSERTRDSKPELLFDKDMSANIVLWIVSVIEIIMGIIGIGCLMKYEYDEAVEEENRLVN